MALRAFRLISSPAVFLFHMFLKASNTYKSYECARVCVFVCLFLFFSTHYLTSLLWFLGSSLQIHIHYLNTCKWQQSTWTLLLGCYCSMTLFACASFLLIMRAESGASSSGEEAHVKPRCCYKLSHERISILKWFKLSDCNGRLYASRFRESRHSQGRRSELSSDEGCCSTYKLAV